MSTEKSLLPGATRDLAAFASNLRFADIPHEAVERMKLSVLDSMELRSYSDISSLRILQTGNRLSITPVDPSEWKFIMGIL